MVEQDTIKLLRECDAGIKMGISALDEVTEYAHSTDMRNYLRESTEENEKLKNDLQEVLADYNDNGKEPNPIASGMSWIKTNVKLKMNESDSTIAELMTDGCNMGIKSLKKYMNEYPRANAEVQKLCQKLIAIEEELAKELTQYL